MTSKVLSIELSEGLRDITDLAGYEFAQILIRNQGRPIGSLRLACWSGTITTTTLTKAINQNKVIQQNLAQMLLRNWLNQPEPNQGPQGEDNLPTATVIVCTRNRPEHLQRCLTALMACQASGVDFVVVDNAPSDDRSALIAAGFPVQYLLEPTPGLHWARRTGARKAQGDVLIYTDDDVRVDPGWVAAMRAPFVDQNVAIVTGLVVAGELDTPSQEAFERYYSFNRGFERREFDLSNILPLDTDRVGVGASTALRRKQVIGLDLFGPELGAGTSAQAGDESYAFYRLLSLGYRAVYTPDALAWHYHRRDNAALIKALHGYNTGFYAVLFRSLLQHRDPQALKFLWWLTWERLWWSVLDRRRGPNSPPAELAWIETRGTLAAPKAYLKSRWREKQLAFLRKPDKKSEDKEG